MSNTTRASYEKHEFLTLRERLGLSPNFIGSALLIILVFFVFLFIYLCDKGIVVATLHDFDI